MESLVAQGALVAAMAMGAGTTGCSTGLIASSTGHESVDASADAEGGTLVLPESGASTGEVGVSVSVFGDQSPFVSIAYTLSNGATTYTGGTEVSGGTVATFVIPGVLPGDGYVVSVSITTMDGNVCTGQSAPVIVTARQTAPATVHATCEWGVSPCPTWNTLVANPPTAGLPPNDEVLVTVTATGPDPAATLTFAFRVTAGTGTLGHEETVSSNPGDASGQATFTCPARIETDTIEVLVGDSELPDASVCPPSYTTATITVVCTGTPVEAGADASEND